MDELEIEMPFSITADIGEGDQEFLVIPDWDEEQEESEFTILLDGVQLGVLKCIDIEEWEWLEGSLTRLEAMVFGEQIDNHYNH
ncbi:hypothetical protein [Pedobacter sp. SYSU D00535]|uniref:hypothetical protein n=1 Tax=Pedobacter sp. SYSU D00535 TaxID=2810308 RepID=UPI001A959D96|nr:hypothetical protein [Pedobacter sp. SYSU D00535]